jgi:acetyl esterase
MAAVSDREIEGPHGPIPIRVYRPEHSALGTGLVWLHGGAFTMGDLDMPEADWVSRELAARGITIVSVFYRLAVDGIHFPVPSDDCVTAFEWANDNVVELGITPGRLSIGGASAGGNLAASVGLRLRDAALNEPSSLVLSYPLLHLILPLPSPALAEKLLTLPPQIQALNTRVGEITANYVVGSDDEKNPYAFPALGDVTGLPPVFVLNADVDILRPSGEAFAASIALAGGEVRSGFEPGTMHGYLNQPDTPEALSSIGRIAAWLLEQ